jgi:hypothetical protein
MKEKEKIKIQLIISSLIVVLGIVAMILAGNTDSMYFYWLPHLWWVIIMTKFLTSRFPDKNKFIWASLTVVIGFALYFGTLWLIIPWILKMFGVNMM